MAARIVFPGFCHRVFNSMELVECQRTVGCIAINSKSVPHIIGHKRGHKNRNL